jgi:hypothetical protein
MVFHFLDEAMVQEPNANVNLNQTKEKSIQNLIIPRLVILGEGGGGVDPMIFVYSMKHLNKGVFLVCYEMIKY